MKVFEILSPNKFQPQDIDGEQTAHNKFIELNHGEDDNWGGQDTDKIKRLGSGAFGTAHATHEEPGTVYKVVRPIKDLEDDGYYQYLKMLASHAEGSDNRYFPKIYDIQVYKSKDSGYTYKVEMERLVKFDNLSTEEMIEIGNQLISNFDAIVNQFNGERRSFQRQKYYFKTTNNGDPESRIKKDKHQEEYSLKYRGIVENGLIRALQAAITPPRSYDKAHSGPSTNIKDPEFKRAIVFLRGFIKKSYKNLRTSRGPDIHKGNIMVRRGPFLPQLVFTDPVV